MVADHVAPLFEPLDIALLHPVVIGETRHQAEEEDEHHQPQEGVQDVRPGTAAEQAGQLEQRQMEQHQPRQPGHEEQDRHGPVVIVPVGVVALDFIPHFRLLGSAAAAARSRGTGGNART